MSALRLPLSASPRFAALLVALHVAAGACAVLVVPGAGGIALGAALAALGGAAAWRLALLRSAASIRALELGEQGLAVELASGARLDAPMPQRRYVSRHLVALPLAAPAGRTVVVTSDMLAADSFRALRIWALWGRAPGARGPVVGKQLLA